MDRFSQITEELFRDQEHNRIVTALQRVISGASEGGSIDDTEDPSQPQPQHQQQRLMIEFEGGVTSSFQPSNSISSTGTGTMMMMMMDVGTSTGGWRDNCGTNQLPENENRDKKHKEKEKKEKKKKKRRGVVDGTTTNYRGVRQRSEGKWVAEIKYPHKDKRFWLGTFFSAEEAARAYDRKSIELRGDQAITNFPLSEYADNKDHPSSSQQPRPSGALPPIHAPVENSQLVTNTTTDIAGMNITSNELEGSINNVDAINNTADAGGTSTEENEYFWDMFLQDDTILPDLEWMMFDYPPPSTS